MHICVCETSITTGYWCVIRTYNQTCTRMLSAKDSQADPIGKFAKTGKAIPCRLSHCWLSHFGKSPHEIPHCWQTHIEEIKMIYVYNICISIPAYSIFPNNFTKHIAMENCPFVEDLLYLLNMFFLLADCYCRLPKSLPQKKVTLIDFIIPYCPWFGYAVVIKHGSLENPQTKWRTEWENHQKKRLFHCQVWFRDGIQT